MKLAAYLAREVSGIVTDSVDHTQIAGVDPRAVADPGAAVPSFAFPARRVTVKEMLVLVTIFGASEVDVSLDPTWIGGRDYLTVTVTGGRVPGMAYP